MQGKRVLITGATSGIGKQTALKLAGKGAQIILVSRREEKCQRVKSEIAQQTGSQQVDFLVADLSSLDQIRATAAEITSTYRQLDVLINNAGALFWERQESADGIEMTLALNHLNYFYLTLLLLDLLKASAAARIINVSSDAHRGQQLDFDDLQHEESYRPFRAYGESKLANLYFTYELDRKIAGTGTTVNAVHPGFVATNFAIEGSLAARLFMPLVHLFALSPSEGAETPVYLASSPGVEGISGKYFHRKTPVRSSPVSYDREAAKKLWQRSRELTGLSD